MTVRGTVCAVVDRNEVLAKAIAVIEGDTAEPAAVPEPDGGWVGYRVESLSMVDVEASFATATAYRRGVAMAVYAVPEPGTGEKVTMVAIAEVRSSLVTRLDLRADDIGRATRASDTALQQLRRDIWRTLGVAAKTKRLHGTNTDWLEDSLATIRRLTTCATQRPTRDGTG